MSLIAHFYVVPNMWDLPFIFGTQMKIFLMKSESFLSLHRQQGTFQTSKAQKGTKDIVKIDVHQWFNCRLWSNENTFVCKENKNNDFNYFCSTKVSRQMRVHSSACKQGEAHPWSTSERRLLHHRLIWMHRVTLVNACWREEIMLHLILKIYLR